ncbi:MAG: hypothetical protein K1X78_03495 [Verrucomicrobiaceae bacterium]|nr:hypothetical protein [Verrucomicrobiaceae bacterium]
MIKVTLSDLILIGMAIGVVFVCMQWVLAVLAERRASRRISDNVVFCRICGSAYQVEKHADITICPVCRTPNERNTMDAI